MEQKKPEPIIKVKEIKKIYRIGPEKVVALNSINLEVFPGQIVCIVGTSGSGKSTLLNQLAGLEKPTSGAVYIGKHNISKFSENQLAKFRQKNIGFIFQSYNLIGSNTAMENVAMPLMFKGVLRAKREKLAKEMLSQVGLGQRYMHRPNQMSGGQQQRVGIARAFVAKPKIVFADEPTGNLDTKTTLEVMEMMVKMSREHGITLLLVTHDQYLAQYADRIITLIDGNVVGDVSNISLLERLDKDEIIEKYISEKALNIVSKAVTGTESQPQAATPDQQTIENVICEAENSAEDLAAGAQLQSQAPETPQNLPQTQAEEPDNMHLEGTFTHSAEQPADEQKEITHKN